MSSCMVFPWVAEGVALLERVRLDYVGITKSGITALGTVEPWEKYFMGSLKTSVMVFI